MEAKGLSVRRVLWFSAAEPRAPSSLGIMQHLPNCQTPGATSSMHMANMPHCNLLHLPGWAPAEGSYRYLQKSTKGKISSGSFHPWLQVWSLCLAMLGRDAWGAAALACGLFPLPPSSFFPLLRPPCTQTLPDPLNTRLVPISVGSRQFTPSMISTAF